MKIYGQILYLSVEQYEAMHPEVRSRMEQMGSDLLKTKYGVPAATFLWRHEDAMQGTDPDTGEEYTIPERWALVVESDDQSATHAPQ